MKSKILILGILLITQAAFAQTKAPVPSTGTEHGNGGDMCEKRIKEIREDILAWINLSRASELKLPRGVTLDHYSSTMRKLLSPTSRVQITCVSKGDPGYPVRVHGKPKTCRNDRDRSNKSITCDLSKFNETDESEQYVLIHHEFAGLARFEVTEDGDSNYPISDQISGYLQDTGEKKLVVRPDLSNASIGKYLGYRFWGDACQRVLSSYDLQPGFNPGYLGECDDLRKANLFRISERLEEIKRIDKAAVLENLNLSGALLDGLDLHGLRFNGTNFRGASFKDANLRGTDLSDTDLSLANFSGADLTLANLSNAKVNETVFTKARLIATKMDKTAAWEASFEGAEIDDDTVFPPKYAVADFTTQEENRKAVYQPELNASVEVRYEGKTVVVNRQSLTAPDDENHPPVIPWDAPSQVKSSPMCFRGDPAVALEYMADSFQMDEDYCGGVSYEDRWLKFTGCHKDGEEAEYPISIPRCT